MARLERSSLGVAVGWGAWSAPASVWAVDGGRTLAEDVFESPGIVFERPTLKLVQKHWE